MLFLGCLPGFGETALERLVDRRISAALAKDGSPSISVAIVREGRILYAKAFGKADLASRRKADLNTVYPIGSITKQFVAAAVLLLQESGRLSLDDEVDKHLPGFPHGKEVRMFHLLSHTSGYEDYAYVDYFLPEWASPVPISELLAIAGKEPLGFVPGTRFAYSNTNYSIAGAIVEKASGTPLHQYLREKIFLPLQLTSAGICTQIFPAEPPDTCAMH